MKVAWNINNVSLSGNSEEVLRDLYAETNTGTMPTDAMNKLVTDYTGSTRFVDRCKDMTVVRWSRGKGSAQGFDSNTAGGIPFDDLLKDWAEIGLISEKVLTDSLIVRKYEQAIVMDTTIKQAQLEMAAELCVEMSIEDAIFNGIKSTQGE
jgi:hypothetical protein|tara:strand:+ start:55 stop:507 length:453 start_codon:yes stop_codon:yes gene_type:complete